MVGRQSWDPTNNHTGGSPLPITADAVPAALHHNSASTLSFVTSPLSTSSTEPRPTHLRSKPHSQPTPKGADSKQRNQRPGRASRKTVALSFTCSFDGCKNTQPFARQYDFNRHYRTHDPPLECPAGGESGCKKRFTTKKDRDRHVWVHHRMYALQHPDTIGVVEAKCPECGERQRVDNLKRHRQTHY